MDGLLDKVYSHVTHEMSEVDRLIREAVISKTDILAEASCQFLAGSGKRLRPVLVILAGKCCQGRPHGLVRLAAALELMHMASLVHDDIIDQAPVRRGQMTANVRWGNHVAVLLGDYFYGQALKLASPLGCAVNRGLAQIVSSLVEGEFTQMLGKREPGISEDHYMRLISRKTARFISLCCRLGAGLGRPSREIVSGLSRYGFYTGMAYQIIDDIFDITGPPHNGDKAVRQDLKGGVITLPLIHALKSSPCNDELRKLVNRPSLNGDELGQIEHLVRLAGSLDYSKNKAREFITRAQDCLRVIPAGGAREALGLLAKYLGNEVS